MVRGHPRRCDIYDKVDHIPGRFEFPMTFDRSDAFHSARRLSQDSMFVNIGPNDNDSEHGGSAPFVQRNSSGGWAMQREKRTTPDGAGHSANVVPDKVIGAEVCGVGAWVEDLDRKHQLASSSGRVPAATAAFDDGNSGSDTSPMQDGTDSTLRSQATDNAQFYKHQTRSANEGKKRKRDGPIRPKSA